MSTSNLAACLVKQLSHLLWRRCYPLLDLLVFCQGVDWRPLESGPAKCKRTLRPGHFYCLTGAAAALQDCFLGTPLWSTNRKSGKCLRTRARCRCEPQLVPILGGQAWAGTVGGSLAYLAWPDASGNCISWLSRALRTFARTLTMDSHAGCGGEELCVGSSCCVLSICERCRLGLGTRTGREFQTLRSRWVATAEGLQGEWVGLRSPGSLNT